MFSSRFNISVMSVLQFQSLSISLSLKLTDTIIERSDLVVLFHKFRSCLTEQMIFYYLQEELHPILTDQHM